jgi:4-hydroxybenzoate polyprenyltransferase
MPTMTWSVALRLGRVSNLPTVTSNVLAAVALSGARPAAWHIAIVCLAMSMLYVAGMYLNDAFDRDIDARERPDRPIPARQVAALTVFGAGFGLLGGGVLVIAVLCLMTGDTYLPTVSAAVLAGVIVLYDVHHKGSRFSPVVMGLCRVGVYITASLAVSGQLDRAVLIGSGCLLAYLIGLTYIARAENLREIGALWPLAFLSVPFLVARPTTGLSWAIYLGFALWTVRALRRVIARDIRAAVTSLIAGISLLDALFIARLDRPIIAGAAVAAFAVTRAFQRAIPGT